MKGKRNRARRRRQTIQAWTHEQAQAATPYLASILHSLREHRLEWQAQQRRAEILTSRSGRPNRKALMEHQETLREAQRAQDDFEAALAELHALDIYCLDPLRGEALIPFVHADQLAWFVFELFESPPLRFWRYHADELEMRRPVAEVLEGPKGETVIV
jgi:hypothetical protein